MQCGVYRAQAELDGLQDERARQEAFNMQAPDLELRKDEVSKLVKVRIPALVLSTTVSQQNGFQPVLLQLCVWAQSVLDMAVCRMAKQRSIGYKA